MAWSQDGALAGQERRVLGLESSDDFRTNLGIVNPTGSLEQSFLVKILDAGGVEAGRAYYRLGPRAHIQRNDILREMGLEGAGFTAVVRRTRAEALGGGVTTEAPDFVVYGSKVDQRSNDPTYLEAQTETTQSGLPRHRVVPAAANTVGNDGSLWRTDVTVHAANEGGVAALVVELVPTGGTGIPGGNPERLVTSIRGGETKSLSDIIGASFPDHEVAALVVRGLAGGAGSTDLRVASRTWTPTGDGSATMGQGIPGIPRRSISDPVVIPGLEASAEFRTNLGLVNPSLNLRQTFELEVFSGDGSRAGALSYVLEPWSHLQINGILDELELEGEGFSAIVTLTESENLMLKPSESWDPVFMAYGSRVDRATNDPTFIEGVRLTPEPPKGQGDWVDFSTDEPWYRCPSGPAPDEATVVRAFERAAHWFGSENHRSVTREVDFPSTGEWNQVGLRLHLECPESGICDHWDRTGSLQLVLNPADPEDEWEYLEVMRHITPYRVGMCQYVDITPLAPLLTGRQTLVSWIDTWVGPGPFGWRRLADHLRFRLLSGRGSNTRRGGQHLGPAEHRRRRPRPRSQRGFADRAGGGGHPGGREPRRGKADHHRAFVRQLGKLRRVLRHAPGPLSRRREAVGPAVANRLRAQPRCQSAGDLAVRPQRLVSRRHHHRSDHRCHRHGDSGGDRDTRLRHPDGQDARYENTNPGGGSTPIEWVSLQLYIFRD